ncbi:hypothetical protein AB0M22_29255 [Nocardia sp. NPDC051756]|uniref:DUF3592 domain-containing protein n=1 Tax=Nocardia sp. NPDC051756 TaxID=3154751 RepID=UPI0034168735
MSTVPPRSGVERRIRRAGPSGVKQAVFLACGVVAGALLSASAPRVGSQPLWLFALIPSLWVAMIGLIVVSAWRTKTVVAGVARTWVGPVEYLAAGSGVAGVVPYLSGDTGIARLIGSGLLVFAVFLVGLAAVGYLHRWRQRGAAGALRARSVRTLGVVTSTGLQEFPATPNPKMARLTVEFTDDAGTRRWLTPSAFQVPGNPIDIDDEVVVWFDPEDPGDIARIVVEFDNGVSRITKAR